MKKVTYPMVKILALLFLTVGVCQTFAAWDGSSTEEPELKDGYYLIENEANLAWFRDEVNKTSGVSTINAKLMASLDMGGNLFVPIAAGSGKTGFKGTFDGNGFTISNLYINSEELGEIPNKLCTDKPNCNAQNAGFIGVLKAGTVKNLNLENVDVVAATNIGAAGGNDNPVSVGPIVAHQENGTIENCFASGNILTSGQGNGIGGIVGNAWSGKIKNCLSTVDVWVSGDDSFVGGVVGYVRKGGTVTIESCAYDGSIIINSGNGVAGGIAGYFEEGNLTVTRAFYDSDVIGKGIGKQTDSLTLEGDGSPRGVKNLNTKKIVCELNGGEWKDNACTEQGEWNLGVSHIALHGTMLDANKEIVYAVTFSPNGGTFKEGANYVKYLKAGETITDDEISIPVHGDTVFGGWALTANATKAETDLGTVTASKTIYAFWKQMYEVTFDANGGTFPDKETSKKKVVGEDEVIDIDGIDLPTTYTDNGTVYYFKGWGLSADATDAQTDLGVASKTTKFYAVWTKVPTYTVTFNTRGHGTSFVVVESGKKVTEPKKPSVKGYAFGGWYSDKGATKKFSFDTAIKESIVLYAKWTLTEYKITYELDGGTNSKDNPKSYTIESNTIKLKTPTKKGYIFLGWYYNKSEGVFSNKASQITSGSTGDKTLYAKWTIRTYTITYMAGSKGTGIIRGDIKNYGEDIELETICYMLENHIQTGWATEDGGPKKYELGAKYSLNANLILYPYWEAEGQAIRYGVESHLGSFSVVTQGRTLEILGTKANTKWAIYDMRGSLVARGITLNSSSRVEIPRAGAYYVRAGDQFRLVQIR